MIVIIIIALLIGWFINEMDKAQRRTTEAIQYGRLITLESLFRATTFFPSSATLRCMLTKFARAKINAAVI
jgi:hypothetical protein